MKELYVVANLLRRLRDSNINGKIEDGTLVLISDCGEFQTDVNIDNLIVPGDMRLQADFLYYYTRRLLRMYRRKTAYNRAPGE